MLLSWEVGDQAGQVFIDKAKRLGSVGKRETLGTPRQDSAVEPHSNKIERTSANLDPN